MAKSDKAPRLLRLVRHAKSSWQRPLLPDLQRPLNTRGKGDSRDLGRHLANRGEVWDLVLVSPARRTRTTAKRVFGRLPDKPQREEELRLYLAGVGHWYEVLRETDESVQRLGCVGHNPGMTDFYNDLTGEALSNMPTCGTALIEIPVPWRELGPGTGRLIDYSTPKQKVWGQD